MTGRARMLKLVLVAAAALALAGQLQAHAQPAQAPLPAYQAMPQDERIALQSDLTWAGVYNGAIDGDFGARSVDAVKAFQKSIGAAQSGVLDADGRARLAAMARDKHSFTGWRIIGDPASGVRLGVPLKLAPQQSKGPTGTRWTSAQGQIQIETWVWRESGLSLAKLVARERGATPARQISYTVAKDDFFVMSGMQGLKKFYVRGQLRSGEARGMTVLYDQATEGVMDPVVIAMSSAFSAFPVQMQASAPVARRKVEYATGLIVGAGDVIVTAKDAVEACTSISVAGFGDVQRAATDDAASLALLRGFGRAFGPPFAIRMPAQAQDLTASGIADPQLQDGGSAVSHVRMKAEVKDGGVMLSPLPPAGFAGAPLMTGDARLAGLVVTRPDSNDSAALASVATLRDFLARETIPLAAGAERDDVKASLRRVICVRR